MMSLSVKRYKTKLLFVMSIVSVFTLACAQQTESYDDMLQDLYSHTIDTITSHAVKKEYLILDTRELSEYTVSHIKGAVHVGYDDLDLTAIKKESRDKVIVVYCTVGYRSEKVGEQVKALGFTKVYNLYGGIFSWVHAGRTLVDSKGKSTVKVHTYDASWGKWLIKGEKVY